MVAQEVLERLLGPGLTVSIDPRIDRVSQGRSCACDTLDAPPAGDHRVRPRLNKSAPLITILERAAERVESLGIPMRCAF